MGLSLSLNHLFRVVDGEHVPPIIRSSERVLHNKKSRGPAFFAFSFLFSSTLKMPASSPKSQKSTPRSPTSHRSVPTAAQNIEVDTTVPEEDEDEIDPGLGTDAESSTASITSSILNYRTINGRTYHSERGNAAYW